MDRDALLVAALGAAAAGCTRGSDRDPDPAPSTASPTPTADPDAALLTSWWLRERSLADAVPAAYVPLRGNHTTRAAAVAEHLAARGAEPPAPPARVAVKDLAKAERDAATRYLGELARAASPDVAVLGAELAAGARQHAVVLATVAAPARSGAPR